MEGTSKSYPKDGGFDQGHFYKRRRFKSDSDFTLKKRVPPRSAKIPGEVYVTNKSNFKGQMAECMKLLESPENAKVIIKGLGAAIPRSVNLALQLKEKLGEEYILDVTTSTVPVTDDIEGVEGVTEQKRDVSAITVNIYKNQTAPDP